MSKLQRGALCALLAMFLILALAPLLRSTPTYDEAKHFAYGEKMWRGDPSRSEPMFDSKMPVSALNVIPWKLIQAAGLDTWLSDTAVRRFAGRQPSPAMAQKIRDKVALLPGKLVTVCGGLLLGIVVFAWARQLYGVGGGLLALTMFVFSPNVLANANLVTVDLFAALGVTLALYAYWQFANRGGAGREWFAGICLGVAQLAKYSCLLLYPIIAVIAGTRTALAGKGVKMRAWLVFGLCSLVVITAGFLFQKTFTPLREYQFRTATLQTLQAAMPWLPVPLPYPFLDGIDYVAHHDQTGVGHGRVYLLGKLAEPGEGIPGYYFVLTLFKSPLAAQVLFWWAVVACFRRFDRERFVRDEAFLLLPVLVFALYFNFFFSTQIGMRFFLLALPLCHVFIGSLAGRLRPMVLGGLLSWQVVSVLSYTPHFLAYANELVPDRKMAYRVFADSNLDWGQNRWYLNRYLAAHPQAHYAPTAPTNGTIVVPVNDLVGVTDPDQYRWLRERFRPSAHIAHSYLVFEVPPTAVP